MKTLTLTLALAAGPFAALAGESAEPENVRPPSRSDVSAPNASVSQHMKITVGKREFTASLQDNPTAAAFKKLLPLSLNMHDVNRNEKAFDFSSDLPTADADPHTIRTGDLMIWSSRTLVVFYKSFPTSYRYTRLGRIDDPAGLAEALGAGNVMVTFELK